jgi:uncharacterized protein (DUF433 family)
MSTGIASLLITSPDVCGGRLRIDGTCVTVNQIVVLYRQGFNAEAIAERYPNLTMAQIFAALAHYHANEEDVEAELAREREETQNHGLPVRGSLENELQMKAFKALQRQLGLTIEKAAEWQDAIKEARR